MQDHINRETGENSTLYFREQFVKPACLLLHFSKHPCTFIY